MGNIYDDARNVAIGIFAEFKQGVIKYVELQAQAGGTPDEPLTPTEVIHPINATARPVSSKFVDGSHIVQSDRQISMPNDGIEPKITGYVTIDGSRYKIIEIMPRPAAGTPVTYTLIVRR